MALCGKMISPEDIHDFSKDESADNLSQWYDVKIGNLTLSSATLVCQRINVTYDRRLKENFIFLIYCSLGVIILICIWPIFTDFSFHNVMIKFFAPIVPLFLYYIDLLYKIDSNIGTLENINTLINQGIEKRKKNEKVSVGELAQIQDLIFLYRKNSFAIPDFFYKIKRNKMENTISYGVDNLCSE